MGRGIAGATLPLLPLVVLALGWILPAASGTPGLAQNPNSPQAYPANGTCIKYNGPGPCGDFLRGAYVWVFAEQTIGSQELAIANRLHDIGTVTGSPQEACGKVWREQLCAAALPPCLIDTEMRFEAPRPICEAGCHVLRQSCHKVFEKIVENDAGMRPHIPRCSDTVGNVTRKNSFMYPHYLDQWFESPIYRPGFNYGPPEAEDEVSDREYAEDEYYVPCWGIHYRAQLDTTKWWQDETLDMEDFRDYCTEANGKFSYDSDDGDYECEFTDSSSCIAVGGEWIAVKDDGRTKFECFLMDDDFYEGGSYSSSSESEQWEQPWVEVARDATSLGDGKYLHPATVIVHAPLDGKIILSAKVNVECNSNDSWDCVPDASEENVRLGLAHVVADGTAVTPHRDGKHQMRLRTVGRGKALSEEARFSFETEERGDDDYKLPPKDSDMVYIRAKIKFAVGNPEVFLTSVLLFKQALVEAINADLGIAMTLDAVLVRKVESNGVNIELRVSSANEGILAERLVDPLFAYPLGAAMFQYGLVNATDSCSAASQVHIGSDGLERLFANTSNATTAIVAVVVVAVVLCIAAVAVCVKMKRLKAREVQLDTQEKKVDQKAADVDKKAADVEVREADLKKREEELESKLRELEEQERELLAEKEQLDKEEEELEAEAEEAAKEMEKVELEELKALDPDGAALLEMEYEEFEASVALEAEAALSRLRDKYQQVVPAEDTPRRSSMAAVGRLALLLRRPKRRGPNEPALGLGEPTSDVARVRDFLAKLDNEEDRAAFKQLLDQLEAKGSLRDVPDDEHERLKAEYEDAMFSLQNDLYERKKQQQAKLAARRKKRLDLVIEDAKLAEAAAEAKSELPADASDEELAATVTAALAAEVEEELDEALEREKARVRAEAPTQDAYEAALAKLEADKQEKKRQQLASIARRREQVRRRLAEDETRLAQERAAAEARQRDVASKVAAVFKRMNSVDTKVKKLKDDHEEARAQLADQVRAERARQREKHAARAAKRRASGNAKVTPDDA